MKNHHLQWVNQQQYHPLIKGCWARDVVGVSLINGITDYCGKPPARFQSYLLGKEDLHFKKKIQIYTSIYI